MAVGEYKIAPSEFYKMTPVEFWWLLEGEQEEYGLHNPGITSEEVKELMRKYPDGNNP